MRRIEYSKDLNNETIFWQQNWHAGICQEMTLDLCIEQKEKQLMFFVFQIAYTQPLNHHQIPMIANFVIPVPVPVTLIAGCLRQKKLVSSHGNYSVLATCVWLYYSISVFLCISIEPNGAKRI